MFATMLYSLSMATVEKRDSLRMKASSLIYDSKLKTEPLIDLFKHICHGVE